MIKKKLFFLSFLLPSFLIGIQSEKTWKTPWFTGPLIAPSGSTNPKGVSTWQPFLQVTDTYGAFDKHWKGTNIEDLWSIQPIIEYVYGLTDFMDVEVIFQAAYNKRGKASSTRLNDTIFFLGFQAMRDKKGSWEPDLRITIQEVFPTGQHDQLSSSNRGTDVSGKGSYQTGIDFNFQKLFEMAPEQYFRLRLSLGYLFPAPTNVHGFSAYGGSRETRGKVYPGQNFIGILSGEYTITRNWVFAFDTQYLFARHDRFSGKRGRLITGEKAKVGNPVSQQISIAPAIEYNFNTNFGVIGGVWFTLAGKNSYQFVSGIISAVISY